MLSDRGTDNNYNPAYLPYQQLFLFVGANPNNNKIVFRAAVSYVSACLLGKVTTHSLHFSFCSFRDQCSATQRSATQRSAVRTCSDGVAIMSCSDRKDIIVELTSSWLPTVSMPPLVALLLVLLLVVAMVVVVVLVIGRNREKKLHVCL